MPAKEYGSGLFLKQNLIEKGGEEGDDAALWNEAFCNTFESRASHQPMANPWRSSSRRSFTIKTQPEVRLSFRTVPNDPVPPPAASAVECGKSSASEEKSSAKAALLATLRQNWQMIMFYLCFFSSISVVFYLIKSIYKDPRILVARFFASTAVVCFVVFLAPFMRGIQGQMYDKLAGLSRFFNPELHKLLGPVFMISGTIHGTIWISCTLQSCTDTWCPSQAFAGNITTQALCVETFCRSNQPGGFPSLADAFGPELPASLIKRQSAVRSFYLGFVCWLLFGTMTALSIPYIRRRCFELFYYGHHLFLIAIPVFFAHCWSCLGNFSFEARMMVFPCGVACLLYACDKLFSVFARRCTSHTVDFIHYTKGNILELRMRPVPAWPLLRRLSSKLASVFGRPSQREAEAIRFAPGANMRCACLTLGVLPSHDACCRRVRRYPVPRNQRVAMAPLHCNLTCAAPSNTSAVKTHQCALIFLCNNCNFSS